MIKTFRGLLADGGQDRIRLQTIKGKVGYRIVKFQILPNTPGTGSDSEIVAKIFKSTQASIDATVNFTDSDLLAASYYQDNTGGGGMVNVIIFDNEIFNQDIYITYSKVTGSQSTNYYIELEVIPLDDAGAQYTTLKDMRST